MLLQLRSVAECELHCLRGSPVGRNAMPEIPSSKASTFLSRSEFAPLRHSAATSIRSAVAGVVSGCNLNIQGMFIEVSILPARPTPPPAQSSSEPFARRDGWNRDTDVGSDVLNPTHCCGHQSSRHVMCCRFASDWFGLPDGFETTVDIHVNRYALPAIHRLRSHPLVI